MTEEVKIIAVEYTNGAGNLDQDEWCADYARVTERGDLLIYKLQLSGALAAVAAYNVNVWVGVHAFMADPDRYDEDVLNPVPCFNAS